MTETEQTTTSALAAIWVRQRPLLEERLAILDHAAASAAAGTLHEDLREEALHTAHKLAGSLGMYGFDHGTRIARQLELLLDYRTPDAARLLPLVAELRATLFPADPALIEN